MSTHVATQSGRVAAPEQCVIREGALKAITIGAAYSLQMEKETGSIVPGKLANFTILADNPVTCDAAKIKDINVWGTIHEGRIFQAEPEELNTAGIRLRSIFDTSLTYEFYSREGMSMTKAAAPAHLAAGSPK